MGSDGANRARHRESRLAFRRGRRRRKSLSRRRASQSEARPQVRHLLHGRSRCLRRSSARPLRLRSLLNWIRRLFSRRLPRRRAPPPQARRQATAYLRAWSPRCGLSTPRWSSAWWRSTPLSLTPSALNTSRRWSAPPAQYAQWLRRTRRAAEIADSSSCLAPSLRLSRRRSRPL